MRSKKIAAKRLSPAQQLAQRSCASCCAGNSFAIATKRLARPKVGTAAQRSIATYSLPSFYLLVAIAKLLQPCTTSLCEAAIFDRSPYEVGSYATLGKNQKAQRSCAGLQSKIATSLPSFYQKAQQSCAGLQSKIATDLLTFVNRLLRAQHNKVVSGCASFASATEGRLAGWGLQSKIATKRLSLPTGTHYTRTKHAPIF